MLARAAALLLSLSLVVWMQLQQPVNDFRREITFDPNEDIASYSPETLKALGFGYDRAMSSLLWLRFLQYTPPGKVKQDHFSWLYRDLRTISELDPYFYPVYEHGAIFLSVITEDKKGAESIFLRGIQYFPERWRIRAFLAYHYHFELNDLPKAAEQYRIGATLPGAPSLLAIVASNFMSKSKSNSAGILFLEDVLKTTRDPEARRRIEEKIQKLRSQLKG